VFSFAAVLCNEQWQYEHGWWSGIAVALLGSYSMSVLVGTGMSDHLRASIPSHYVTGQLCELLHPSGVAKLSTGFAEVKAGMSPVTLCFPLWYVSFHIGEASCKLLYSIWFYLL